MNAPVVRIFGVVLRAVRDPRVRDVVVDRLRRRGAARQPEQPPRAARGAADQARADLRRRPAHAARARCRRPTTRWTRRWPTGRLFAHSVGYSYTSLGRAGLERYYNDQLIGRRTELVGVVDSLLGSDDVGDDLQTTLDPRAQQVAVDALNGRKGAVVALDVKTGRVLVMASEPSFDPNDLDVGRTFQRSRPTTRTRRCSTARRRGPIRRARR